MDQKPAESSEQVEQVDQINQAEQAQPLSPEFSETHSEVRKKHSGLGVASFVLAVIAILAAIGLSVYIFGVTFSYLANEFDPNNPAVEQELMRLLDENPMLIAIFPLYLVTGLMHLIGAILGLIGLFQDNRKKIFAGLGLTLNALPIIGFFVLLIIGLVTAPTV